MANLLYFFLINGLILTEPPFLNQWKEISFEGEGNYMLAEKSLSFLLSNYFGLPYSSEFSLDISYEEKELDFVLYFKKGFSLSFIDLAFRSGISLKEKNPLLIFSIGKELRAITLYGCGGFSYERQEKNYASLFGFALEKAFGNLTLGSEFYKEEAEKIVTLGLNYSLPLFDVYSGIRKDLANGLIFNLGISKNFSF
jgi:hypothetical protein|uniref:Uncharacterized protein n=1 Tax=candidate division WOR-3 bacterium TaxID=2052148 RepID=A0A7V5Y0G1_UNCW3